MSSEDFFSNRACSRSQMCLAALKRKNQRIDGNGFRQSHTEDGNG